MRKQAALILFLALASPASAQVGSEILTLTVAEYEALEDGHKYTINGWVIGQFQASGETDSGTKTVQECLEKWAENPIGLWAIETFNAGGGDAGLEHTG